jgi:Tfp pilus assembly protein PilF
MARFCASAMAHALLFFWYSDRDPFMTVRLATLFVLVASVAASPAAADARSDAKALVDFGISVAQKGLWREAIYRWEKAIETDPTYAAAYNDLAIAYEHEGQLVKARKAYEKALELEPNNSQIQQNFDLFKEINDRSSTGKDK